MRTRLQKSSSDPVPRVGKGQNVHRTVLLHEAIQMLSIREDDIIVDATLGGAGHARAIAAKLGESGTLIGLDLDGDAITRAREALAHVALRTELIEANFRDIDAVLNALHFAHITKALFDLGWSSYQLDSGRGFSFNADEPLRMTYSREEGALTAADAVNTWSEKTLADVIYGFGEERYSRRIAKAIVQRRERKAFAIASDLADVVREAVPAAYRSGKHHPATKTFQALRIAVNDELGALEAGLAGAWKRLAGGGRIAVITFHSVEDRVVKRRMREWEQSGEGERVTRKPIVPSANEVAENPRARSAKLRVIEKTHTSI